MTKPTLAALQVEVGQLKLELKLANEHESKAKLECAKLEADNNKLRDSLMSETMAHTRLRGYMEALRDAEPPRLVPEEKPRHNFQSFNEPFVSTYRQGGEREKPWYHR